MDGKRLIEKIKLRNILSFGDKGEEITLEPLNIIIGQNASGKSNLIDVIKFMYWLPKDRGPNSFIGKNGGISEWIWKGRKNNNISVLEITCNSRFEKENENGVFEWYGDYWVIFGIEFIESSNQRLYIENEEIKVFRKDLKDVYGGEYLDYEGLFNNKINKRPKDSDTSILSEAYLIDSDIIFVGKNFLKNIFDNFKVYSDLQTSRKSEIRKPQIPDAPNDFLEEDGSNLALVLNDLEHRGDTKDKLVENLKKFNPRIKNYSIKIQGGTVQLYLREEGLEKPISAMRLSDGTLRYLCMLAILCHPEPPPLICIEEPETGLHPDILPTIAELMKEASQRTQLIVTTHSDILVSAFSDIPEAVLVCEKDEDGTHFKRLEADELKNWLAEYELGELWLKGEIGGKRW